MFSDKSGDVLGLRFGDVRERPAESDARSARPESPATPAPEPAPQQPPGTAGDSLACALQPLVEKLLRLIRERVATAEPSPDRTYLGERLDSLSRSLLTSASRRNAMQLMTPIVEVCTQLLKTPPRQANSAEIVAALTLVRDAVSSIDGIEQALQLSLAESADRFAALRSLDSLQQIKAGLTRQVDALREVSTAREQQWRRQMAGVERKIRTLETQLAETRLEARHDPLTGLVNRRAVESSFRLFQEGERAFVMALFDVDDFKKVNDTWGHLGGDAALKAIAHTLHTSVRSHDVVGRFGGDEFVVMMVDVSLALAERRLLSVLQHVRSMSPADDDAPKLSVTCGVSEYCAGDTFESLLTRADQALYEAKRAGKNRLGIKSGPHAREAHRR